jgi:hypothetical protein
MEERALLSTFAVTNTGDLNPDSSVVAGSLRAAILAVDGDTTNTAPDTIDFAIPGSGVQTIQPQSQLPDITHPVVIDGYSQPGASPNSLAVGDNAVLLIQLDGELAGPGADGLRVETTATVQGLAVNRFGNSGIDVINPGSVVQGCFIGTDPSGTIALGNQVGVKIGPFATGSRLGTNGDGTDNTGHGLNDYAERNIISGNRACGASVGGSYIHVAGNYIGTDAMGRALAGASPGGTLQGDGVFLWNVSHDNWLGVDGSPDAVGQRNIISNNNWGVEMDGQRNVVAGNFIGTDPAGTTAVPNGAGIQFTPGGVSSYNRIGIDNDGTGDTSEHNIISGNDGAGVEFSGEIDDNVVAGNDIGLDVNGAPLGDRGGGVVTSDVSGVGNRIERNVISAALANGDIPGDGIRLEPFIPGHSLSGTIIAGNDIGTDPTGATSTYIAPDGSSHPLGCGDGVDLNPIGGAVVTGTEIEGNIIAGCRIGVVVEGGAAGAVVSGNWIGTNPSGALLGNPGTGVILAAGTSTVLSNTIAFSGGGVYVVGGSTGNTIQRNSIHDNAGLGIDLGGDVVYPGDGVTPNGSHAPGAPGPNNWQTFPVLTHACAGTASTVIGTFHSTPSDTFRIEFFASTTGDHSGYGQGQRYLGYVNVTTDANGNVLAGSPGVGAATVTVTSDAQGHPQFQVIGLGASAIGEVITATATVLTGPNAGSTSEFSAWFTAASAGSISGMVFSDFNDDGQVDFGEQGIPGVPINLDGTDIAGNPVHLSQTTDADGTYVFQNLAPGTYTVTEAQQPAGYTQGINTVGTAGGTVSGDQFTVSLAACQDAMNYNYGERPAATGPIQHGQTASIGFWNNKNGQALIKALNGGVGTQLGDWLAATFPHMFGTPSGSNNLAGQNNSYVASFFQSRFVVKDQKLDAQVLATALAVYVTDGTLDSTGVGTKYGFTVGGNGVATATYNVGSNGAAFGVVDNTVMTVMDILLAADSQAVNGVLYNGDTVKRNKANNVFSTINQAGGA